MTLPGSSGPLEAALRRAMQAFGAFTDPFTLMEIATILKPLARGGPESVEDERGRLVFESAVSHLAMIFDRMNIEDPRGTAEKIVVMALRECWSTGCS